MRQKASPISGKGSKAMQARRQSTPSSMMPSTISRVKVPSKPASMASPAAISMASMSFVASAIRSPVRWF